MAIYFVFSDESGAYQEFYKKGDEYFIRSSLLFNADNWLALKNRIIGLKQATGIQAFKEFKWNYLDPIRRHQESRRALKETKECYEFKDIPFADLINFVKQCILLFHQYSDSKIIITVTKNKPVSRWQLLMGGRVVTSEESKNISTRNIYKMHLQNLMQRVQYEIQNCSNNLAVIFCDQGDTRDTEVHLKNSYHDIYHNGDFVRNYKNIIDSLSFEHSHHSIGIQVVDYISGIFNSFLKGYETGSILMKDCVQPLIRKSPQGETIGYGIMVVPNGRAEVKTEIASKLENLRKDPETICDDDDFAF